ncbi:hypothetical protein EYF80_031777 [Liparis tanakae]|uniref:Uncharacterized protein n=1 Tax=Liparis tanakae TaxID=230148 RepID=A0A4Z2GX55_9TELE|nr:hypothetical protein EYF80_031777 [Liparis tanakae]
MTILLTASTRQVSGEEESTGQSYGFCLRRLPRAQKEKTRAGKQSEGMPPLRVSHYHVSPDVMGPAAIGIIAARLPGRDA